MSDVHIRHIRKAIENAYASLIDVSDVEKRPPEEVQVFMRTRGLAGYVLGVVANLQPAVAANDVVDGGTDNGTDAIHFDEVERRVHVVQAKWSETGTGGWAR